MLSSYIVGPIKLVLIVDNVGIERHAEKILEKLLNKPITWCERLGDNIASTVCVNISKLELEHDEASIGSIIQTLKLNSNVSQVFCWATCKNVNSRLLVPLLEHQSNAVVTIESNKILTILTKRKHSSVKLKTYQHELIQGGIAVKEIKPDDVRSAQVVTTALNPEEMGTFKIGNFTSEELAAKENLKLPFEIM